MERWDPILHYSAPTQESSILLLNQLLCNLAIWIVEKNSLDSWPPQA